MKIICNIPKKTPVKLLQWVKQGSTIDLVGKSG